MKKNLALSTHITKALFGVMLLNSAPTLSQEPIQPSGRKPLKQRAQEQFKTLKEDWRCLRQKGWKGCSRGQRARIAAELIALTALIIGGGTAIYKGGKAWRQRRWEREEEEYKEEYKVWEKSPQGRLFSAKFAQEVKDAIAAGVKVNALSPYGMTALHQAITSSNPEVVQALINERADVNAKSRSWGTPLDWAQHLQDRLPGDNINGIVRILKDAGALTSD